MELLPRRDQKLVQCFSQVKFQRTFFFIIDNPLSILQLFVPVLCMGTVSARIRMQSHDAKYSDRIITLQL